MRTLCDVCESAAALLFCAADEAALCLACDHKVHMCNKLASRHVRVGLASPVDVPRCDICENSPAFFYCEVDGSSLCLQCDMSVHVGGKRKHGRYLLLRQRVKFPGDETEDPPANQLLDSAEDKREYSQSRNPVADDDESNRVIFQNAEADADGDRASKMDTGLIDLNVKFHCEASNDPPG